MNEHNQYLIQIADRFLSIPLPIVLVHGVDEALRCSCGDTECEKIGKHQVKYNPDLSQILDVQELREDLSSGKPRNIAARIQKGSGVIVIDVDKKNGGLESYEQLEAQLGSLPKTLKTLSGGGGFHLYFKIPKESNDADFVGTLKEFKGIDFISNKNIVLPGSRHHSGNRYVLDKNAESINFEIAELPANYLKMLTKSTKKGSKTPKGIQEGGRNTTLYKIAARMFSAGSPEDSVRAKLTLVNESQCVPPLSSAEVEDVIESAAKQQRAPFQEYSFVDGGTQFDDGESSRLITNFHGKIAEQIEIDDGSPGLQDRRYRIKIDWPEIANSDVVVTPEQLEEGSWVPRTDASLVIPGAQTYRQHVRVALRTLGDLNNRKKVFINLGWAKVNEENYFLANNGAIGASGFTDKYFTSADFGGPTGYEISEATADDLNYIFQRVMALTQVADDKISIPLLASVFRAPLNRFCPTDFCIGVFGPTGTMKSTVVGLFASFYSSCFSFNNLPESFSSTQNSIERRAFLTNSSLLIIDDWVPGESSKFKADGILRSHGNRQGRGRMNQDLSLKKTFYPRSLTILTGEDIQVEQSLRARLVIIEMQKPNDKGLLSSLQKDAKKGLFTKFLGSYVKWIIQNDLHLSETLDAQFEFFRDDFIALADSTESHGRTAPNLAHLMLGLENFGKFCVSKSLMSNDLNSEFQNRCRTSLTKLIDVQNRHQELTDPANRFVESLRSLFEKGDVHVRHSPTLQGVPPKFLGYINRGSYGFEPSGECIGEIIEGDMCLRKNVSFIKAKDFAFRRGDPIHLSERGMGERLIAKGYVSAPEGSRSTTKRTFEGHRERCWVIPNWRQIFIPRAEAPTAPIAPAVTSPAHLSEKPVAASKESHDTVVKQGMH